MLRELILKLLMSIPVFSEDRSPDLVEAKRHQVEMVASSIDIATSRVRWSGSREDLARLMVVTLRFESSLSLRIHAGDCRALECDKGKARGPYQQHVTRLVTQSTWERLAGVDQESTNLASLVAARQLAGARHQCAKIPGDWVRMTIAAYAGRGCLGWFRGIDQRVEAFHRLERTR